MPVALFDFDGARVAVCAERSEIFVVPFFLPVNLPLNRLFPPGGWSTSRLNDVIGRECCTESPSYADAVICTARIVSVTGEFRNSGRYTHGGCFVRTRDESDHPLHFAYSTAVCMIGRGEDTVRRNRADPAIARILYHGCGRMMVVSRWYPSATAWNVYVSSPEDVQSVRGKSHRVKLCGRGGEHHQRIQEVRAE